MTDRYDDPVEIVPGVLRLSADAMRGLRKATGRSMKDLMDDDDDEAARLQVQAFAELYRRYARLGHPPDAGELWDRAGLVELEFNTGAGPIDPLDGGSSTTSPPSAATGG